MSNTSGPLIITPDSIKDGQKVAGSLVLPKGKFFFGYTYVPFDPAKAPKAKEQPSSNPEPAFQGEGNSLRRSAQPSSSTRSSKPAAAKPASDDKPDPWANLGNGNTLSGRQVAPEPPKAKDPLPQDEIIDATMLDEDDFMFDESYNYDDDDDDDIIEIDSD